MSKTNFERILQSEAARNLEEEIYQSVTESLKPYTPSVVGTESIDVMLVHLTAITKALTMHLSLHLATLSLAIKIDTGDLVAVYKEVIDKHVASALKVFKESALSGAFDNLPSNDDFKTKVNFNLKEDDTEGLF